MVVLLVGAAPLAQTPEAAQDDSIESLRTRANAGDAAAQHNLGLMYATSEGVPRDNAEAMRWFRLAAEQGHPGGQFSLGVNYDRGGAVVPQDDAEAVWWYRLAAEQGHADAQFNLGLMYATGRSVLQNDAKAVRWYRLAAEQGDAEAQLTLGSMYRSGRGVSEDNAEAVRWYLAAAEQGYAKAQFLLGLMMSAGPPADTPHSVDGLSGATITRRNTGTTRRNTGTSVPKDAVTAHMWLDLAATAATDPHNIRDAAAERRDRIWEGLTDRQRAEAQRLAREWFEAHPPE